LRKKIWHKYSKNYSILKEKNIKLIKYVL